jgi:hypothetical protein
VPKSRTPDQYPTMGDYSSCVSSTHSIDPKTETCSPDASSERAELTKMFIGNFPTLQNNFSTVMPGIVQLSV